MSDQKPGPKFGHVGLQVADMDASLAFYEEVIGMRLIERQLRSDAYLGTVTGYPGVILEMAVLESEDGILLELLHYTNTPGTPIDPATANPGTAHVCIIVSSVDEVFRRAVDAGYGAVNPPVVPTTGRWRGGRSVYLMDPDGIRVELVQPRGSSISG